MSAFWNACLHMNVGPPDEMGEGICASCGAAIRTTLTPANLADTFERLRRVGYHSMRCVRSDLGWVCADDCPTVRAWSA